jgi:hypothetical protein
MRSERLIVSYSCNSKEKGSCSGICGSMALVRIANYPSLLFVFVPTSPFPPFPSLFFRHITTVFKNQCPFLLFNF